MVNKHMAKGNVDSGSSHVRMALPIEIVVPRKGKGESLRLKIVAVARKRKIAVAHRKYIRLEQSTATELCSHGSSGAFEVTYTMNVEKRKVDDGDSYQLQQQLLLLLLPERAGILYHIKENVFGLSERHHTHNVELDSPELTVSSSEECSGYQCVGEVADLLKIWQKVGPDAMSAGDINAGISETQRDRIRAFSMKPATIGNTNIDVNGTSTGDVVPRSMVSLSALSPVKTNPRDYLSSRYHNTLYSQNTPLSYFSKSAVVRFKNMCPGEQIVPGLRKLCLLAEDLDRRHSGKFGLLIPLAASRYSELESNCRVEFLEKHKSSIGYIDKGPPPTDEKHISALMKLSAELRMRETQLQIILLLELLCHWLATGEQDFFDNNEKAQQEAMKEMQRQSKLLLVRKRGPKRKVVPTFLGMGVVLLALSAEAGQSPVPEEQDHGVFIYSTLNSLIDRIGIWDTLSETKASGDATYEFLAYVLVPYYNKRIPVTTKYIIDKIKGLTLKFTRKGSSSATKSSSTSKTSSRIGSPTREADASSLRKTPPASPAKDDQRPSKYRKTLLREKRPLLRSLSRSLSVLGDDILPSFSIKRSKSNVMSSKNLEKRQVDISKSFSEEKKPLTLPDMEPRFIFANAKRSKSSISTTNEYGKASGALLPQVAATPIKKSKSTSTIPTSQVQSTPVKGSLTSFAALLTNSNTSASSSQSQAQVQSTPRTTRQMVVETPRYEVSNLLMAPPKLKPSVFEKLQESASKDNPIQSSSQRNDITSSPVSSERRRPGAPILAQDSPFFGSNFHGSPISSNSKRNGNFTDDVEEIDSDYERLIKLTPQKQQQSKSVFGRASKGNKAK